MNTSQNNFDSIEKIIFEEGLRIQAIDIHKELDLMLIILGVHWIQLDEDLSRKGFLKDEIKRTVYNDASHLTGKIVA